MFERKKKEPKKAYSIIKKLEKTSLSETKSVSALEAEQRKREAEQRKKADELQREIDWMDLMEDLDAYN